MARFHGGCTWASTGHGAGSIGRRSAFGRRPMAGGGCGLADSRQRALGAWARSRRFLGGAVVFALFGMAGGWLLGQLAVGEGIYRTARGEIRSSFAELNGNPEAIAADPAPTTIPCPGCADARAYRKGTRLNSSHYCESRMPFSS